MNTRHMIAPITSPVTSRRSRFAILAVAVTVAAALLAWFLAAVVRLPEPVVVTSVMVVSFISSWVVTNARSVDHRHHRLTLVPIRSLVR